MTLQHSTLLCCLAVFGLLVGVDWVLLTSLPSLPSLPSLKSPPEFSLFLWRPGDAEAVLLVFCGAVKRSEDSPGLDLALEVVLADQVLLLLLLLLLLLALFLLAYASAAWSGVRVENKVPLQQ